MRGDFPALLDDEVGGLAHDDSGQPHGTGGMRAAAFFDDVGVAFEDVHVVERHPEPFRDALRKSRFVALSARQGADDDIDPAFRTNGDIGSLARIAAGGFQIVAQADAAQTFSPARFGAAAFEALPVAELHGAIHHHAIGAVVVGDALRVGVRQRRGGMRLRRRSASRSKPCS